MATTICKAICKNGTPCKCKTKPGSEVCGRHQGKSECPVCYSCPKKSEMTTLECGHSFCTDCITKWLEDKDTCPMCRHQIKPSSRPSTIYVPGPFDEDPEIRRIVFVAERLLRVDRQDLVREFIQNMTEILGIDIERLPEHIRTP